MKLASDWRKVLRYAWSVRLMALAFLLIIFEPVASMLLDLSAGWSPVLRIILSIVDGLVLAGAILARVVAQKGLSDGK